MNVNVDLLHYPKTYIQGAFQRVVVRKALVIKRGELTEEE
jgi:hypothetical protein